MRYIFYILAFIIANFIVLEYGKIGILLASLIFIPFDFVIRCYFQEKWTGKELFLKMSMLILTASIISYIINFNIKNIAAASFFSFLTSQIFASFLYQLLKNKAYFIKVNGSDLLAIVIDSIVFQFVAFNVINWQITAIQVLIKLTGGLIWYLILFRFLKIQNKWM